MHISTRTIIAGGLASTLAASGAALAGFTGLSVEPYVGEGWVANGYDTTELTTYRVWAILALLTVWGPCADVTGACCFDDR